MAETSKTELSFSILDKAFDGNAATPPNLCTVKLAEEQHRPMFAASMSPKVSKGLATIIGVQPFESKHAAIVRQASFASYQNVSLDNMSINSHISACNPSINEPVVFDESDLFERDMHAFLDAAGIFQVNVKQQLECEKKS